MNLSRFGITSLGLMAVITHSSAFAGRQRLAVAWDDFRAGAGMVQRMETSAPWNLIGEPVAVGRQPVLREGFGKLYAVSQSDSQLDVVNVGDWSVAQTFELPPGTEPMDVAVVNPTTAYLTPRLGTHLLRLDLATGATEPVVDLSVFANDDGIPDLGMMAEHEGRLFVQIRRERHGEFTYEPPALLAVVDLATESLIDVDPARDGVQAIQLAGTAPKFKMQVQPETNQLLVGATGGGLDDGGIEAIDLNALTSEGLIVEEARRETGLDLGGFVMVTPEHGFLAYTTDLTLSSHLHKFHRDGTVEPEQLHVGTEFLATTLIYEAATNSLFFPNGGGEDGVFVFDATTGAQISRERIATPSGVLDMALVPEPGTWGAAVMFALAGAARGARHSRWKRRHQ